MTQDFKDRYPNFLFPGSSSLPLHGHAQRPA